MLVLSNYYRIASVVMHSDGSGNNTEDFRGYSLVVHWKSFSEFC